MSGNICRCGTYQRIRAAIQRARRSERTSLNARHENDLTRFRGGNMSATPVFVIAPHLPGGLVIALTLPACSSKRKGSGELKVIEPNAWLRIGTGRQHHLALRPLGDGPGRVHLAAHADRRRARRATAQRSRSSSRRPATSTHNNLLGGQITGGSTSVRDGWEKLRRAGATGAAPAGGRRGRGMGRQSARSAASRGRRHRFAAVARSSAFGEVAEAAAKLPVPKEVTLKTPADFTLIGTAQKRLDTPVEGGRHAPCTASTCGCQDMLYAALAQPPALGGTVKTFDDEKARSMPGVQGGGAHVLRRRGGRRLLVAGAPGARRARRSSGTRAPTARSTTRRSAGPAQGRGAAAGNVARNDGDAAAAIKRRRARVAAPTTSCRCSRTPRSSRRTARPMCATTASTSTCRRRFSRSRRPRRPRRPA